ncbi:hypothetical protein V8D89_002163, partial [Ganoderma adspersum]
MPVRYLWAYCSWATTRALRSTAAPPSVPTLLAHYVAPNIPGCVPSVVRPCSDLHASVYLGTRSSTEYDASQLGRAPHLP